MLRRRPAQAVVELPIERGDTIAIMTGLMQIDAKLDEITQLLREDDDGEQPDEP